jgi:putative flippase GtrA
MSNQHPDKPSANAPQTSGPQTSGLAHWAGFVGSGVLSFVIDSGVLKLLTVGFGFPVLPSRIASIFTAMVIGWLAHRTFTFRVKERPSWGEFGRFLGVAWSTAALNYVLFAAILWVRPQLDPVIAIFLSGLVAMVWSYVGLRFAAFRK